LGVSAQRSVTPPVGSDSQNEALASQSIPGVDRSGRGLSTEETLTGVGAILETVRAVAGRAARLRRRPLQGHYPDEVR
jgi:hypothetical protein